MYSLDINLLGERPEYQTGKQTQISSGSTKVRSQYSKLPIYLGAGVTALALMAVGAGWVWTSQETAKLEAKQQELDKKLGSLQAQDGQIKQLEGEVAQITGETQALAGVFNQIQPWSAVLQDLRESIPQGVQIVNVTQSEVKTVAPPAPAPTAASNAAAGLTGNKVLDQLQSTAKTDPNAPPKPSPTAAPVAVAPVPSPVAPGAAPTTLLPVDVPTTKLNITGTAKSFDEVNNFMLTLKQSAFFNPDDTQLSSASLSPAPAIDKSASASGQATENGKVGRESEVTLPKIVTYKIQTSLRRTPANDLIRELERKGAVGLVTRLRSLQQQQVIKP